MHSNDGKKLMKASSKVTQTNNRNVSGGGKEGDRKPEGGGNWKKKFNQAMKTPNGLKTVMSVLAEEKKTNKFLIDALKSVQTPGATPSPQITVFNAPSPATPLVYSLKACLLSTSVKLQSILHNNKNEFVLIHTLMRGEHIYRHLIIM